MWCVYRQTDRQSIPTHKIKNKPFKKEKKNKLQSISELRVCIWFYFPSFLFGLVFYLFFLFLRECFSVQPRLSSNLLCRPCYPQTQRSACFSLSNAGTKGVRHCHQVLTFIFMLSCVFYFFANLFYQMASGCSPCPKHLLFSTYVGLLLSPEVDVRVREWNRRGGGQLWLWSNLSSTVEKYQGWHTLHMALSFVFLSPPHEIPQFSHLLLGVTIDLLPPSGLPSEPAESSTVSLNS